MYNVIKIIVLFLLIKVSIVSKEVEELLKDLEKVKTYERESFSLEANFKLRQQK